MNDHGASAPATRVPALDGVRGLAILSVVLWHYVQQPMVADPGALAWYLQVALSLGWSGVDLFFVLSGFLITGILLDHRDSPNFFSVFYVRRAYRILPAYFGLVFIFFGILALAPEFSPATRTALEAWLLALPLPMVFYTTFTQNLVMAIIDKFGAGGISATWSLAVEEQFYLLFPLVVRYVAPRRLPWVLINAAMASLLLRSLISAGPGHQHAAYVLLPCRAHDLLVGALCAWGVRQPHIREQLVENIRALRIAFLVLLVGSVFLTLHYLSWPELPSLGYAWLSLLYGAFLLLALLDRHGSIRLVTTLAPLRRLGAIAYGVYLLHQLILGLCHGFLLHQAPALRGWNDALVTALAALVTLGVAILSWRYFEQPLIALSHRLNYEEMRLPLAWESRQTT